MSETYWTSSITAIGKDFDDMFEAGVVILFGEPVPPALSDVSLVHRADADPARDPAVGDVVEIGAASLAIERLGDKAGQNLRELGHVVLYLDAGEQQLLPGAMHVGGSLGRPALGDRLTLRGA